MGRELLSLCEISKYYTSGQSVVMGLNRISLTFRAGEFVAVTGESGSGKSTLAKVMAGILPYESGEMLVDERPTSHYDGSDWEHYRSAAVSFISQSYDILPGCTVLRNVVSALRLTGMERGEAARRAEELLREVELWDLRGRRAAKLSSGQKQRLSIARALAKPAPILIADEPTGNLDPENSAKVIALLSAAAKSRLVIMITHEFDEAADCATRRITMRDSAVISDISLRPAAEVSDGEQEKVRHSSSMKGMSLYTAGLQISARPVWSMILFFFFALTAFAVFVFLGTFIVNLDDTSTRIYDSSAFRNGSMRRIVVVQPDGGDLTDEDYARLVSLKHVERVERYGYAADLNYFYREHVDYDIHYVASGGGMGEGEKQVNTEITLREGTLFVETVPVLAGGVEFLTEGRLPETAYEAVAGDPELLGQTIPVYIQDVKNWSRTGYLALEIRVVGITDQGEHLYFSDQLGRALSSYLRHGELLVLPDYEQELEGKYLASESVSQQIYSQISAGRGVIQQFTAYGADGEPMELEFAGSHSFPLRSSIVVSPESFERLVEDGYTAQMSLTIQDYAYTDEVLEKLHSMGYGALSPYQIGSTRQNETLAAERMQTLKVCLLALLAVVVLQVVVLRAMFSMETEEYRLMANLGLRCRHAGRSVLWQVVAFTLGGEALAVLALLTCGGLGVERIVGVLRYLPAPYALLTWAVHAAASLLTAVWIRAALRRQVYPVTGSRADLDMGEEVTA